MSLRAAEPPPRPLILVDTIDVGGTGKGVLQLATGLRARGIEPTLANFRYPGRESEFTARARERRFDVLELEQRHRLDASVVERLGRAAAERRCNVIETHSFKAHLVGWRLHGRVARSWVAHAHGWTHESRRVLVYNALERRLLRVPDHVCVVSEQLELHVRAAGRGGPVTLLRNGIEPTRGVDPRERVAARLRYSVDARTRVFAAIGRLSHEKGLDVLLRALAAPPLASARVRVLVAGHGPEHERLRALAHELGVAERVSFLGQVADVRELMAAADVVVMPSRSEGVPNVALESLDAGVPLVAARVGMLPEMIEDGATGWLVPPEDPRALARRLADAAGASPDALAAMGRLARERVLPRFSAARRIERVVAIYRELLAVATPDLAPERTQPARR